MKETSRWVRLPLFLALIAMVLTFMLCVVSSPARSDVTGGWYQQDTGGSNFLFSVAAADAQNIWAVGSTGYIRHSADGGVTWATQTSGTPEDLQEVCAADKNVAWAVGGNGTIIKTVNAGSTWSKQTSGTTELLMSVSAASASVAWAVGNNGIILKTANGGATWRKQTSGTAFILNGVCAVDANTAWAVGGGKRDGRLCPPRHPQDHQRGQHLGVAGHHQCCSVLHLCRRRQHRLDGRR